MIPQQHTIERLLQGGAAAPARPMTCRLVTLEAATAVTTLLMVTKPPADEILIVSHPRVPMIVSAPLANVWRIVW